MTNRRRLVVGSIESGGEEVTAFSVDAAAAAAGDLLNGASSFSFFLSLVTGLDLYIDPHPLNNNDDGHHDGDRP